LFLISGGIFDKNKINEKVQSFNNEISKENFWKDKNYAQKIVKEKKFLTDILDNFHSTFNELDNSGRVKIVFLPNMISCFFLSHHI